MNPRRVPTLVLLVGALVAALLVQEPPGAPEPGAVAEGVQAGVAMPAAPPPGALSSTWFCAGGGASAEVGLGHVVIIANPGPEAVTGTITVLGGRIAPPPRAAAEAGADATEAEAGTDAGTGEGAAEEEPAAPIAPVEADLEVLARSQVQVRLADLIEAPLAGAVVELDGGAVAVEHSVSSELGRATAPCATTAAEAWTFPWGVTSRGNRLLLVFMNPFPDDATLDLELATSEGPRQIGRFDGFVVPARSVVGAYLDQDTRRDQISVHVRVRSGRVVVDRIQTFDGTDGRRGITLGLGAPVPAETWVFPDGAPAGGRAAEQIVVFNPTDGTAEIKVELLTGAEAEDFVEPFSVAVAPGRYSVLDVTADARLDHLEPGTPHSTMVTSLNGVPVVAERVLSWPQPGEGQGGRRGVSATLGAPLGAPRWLLAAGGPTGEWDQWVTVLNLSREAATTVSFTGLAAGQPVAVADLQGLEIPPGGRLAVRLGEHIEREVLPLLIEADGAVVVERGLFRVGGLGAVTVLGIPVAEGVVVPEPPALDG